MANNSKVKVSLTDIKLIHIGLWHIFYDVDEIIISSKSSCHLFTNYGRGYKPGILFKGRDLYYQDICKKCIENSITNIPEFKTWLITQKLKHL